MGDTIAYRRDGTTTQTPLPIVVTHPFELSTLNFVVATPPGAVLKPEVRARSGSAMVFFGSADPHGSPVTGFTVTAQPGGRTVTTGGSATHAELTGLTNGTTYRFTVKATNALGAGPASALSNAVTPRMSTAVIDGRDFSGDGRSDLMALKAPADARDSRIPYLYLGNGRGGFASGGQKMNNSWGGCPTVFSSSDFSGDGKNDVMTVNSGGQLVLYAGNGRSGFYAGRVIGSGWGNFLRVFSPGDFSGDRKNDVMAVSKDGGLYLYRGNGLGRFASAGQRIGNGWGGFLSVFSPKDFSGDHRADVMGVTSTGDLLLYRGNGRGGFASGGLKIGSGWTVYR